MTRYSLPYSQARQLRSLRYALALAALVIAVETVALAWQGRFDAVLLVAALFGGMLLGRAGSNGERAMKRDEPPLTGPVVFEPEPWHERERRTR